MGLRIVLLVVGMGLGMALGWEVFAGHQWMLGLSAATGILVSVLVLVAEAQWQKLPFALNLWGGVGLFAGLIVAGLIGTLTGLGELVFLSPFAWVATLILFLAIPYWGMSVGLRFGREGLAICAPPTATVEPGFTPKLLDTSVIIDGRIADLCETGFIEGTLVVPQFILQELQHISDSSDGLKRARGRRGLDILNVIQKIVNIKVDIVEDDFPHVKEVDTKLIELAKKMDAKVLTNDFNLNKVAGIQGVKVLNINDLCNALKPVVLPGEAIKVFVLKEGKEAGQGVAYLDDGTMVVVDHAKRWIGKNVDVIVTSVLQTSAGRMIFSRLKEETESEELSFARV
ncbi:MAG: TRAM domain-containing protein [Nitrospirales bacterium]|nr:TRAM domain-containing protein [Nitrospira sp.]MCA9481057.1 TRAM domain-containing protein [Nitrospira sp.]MCB9711289.1 TRAM domain-containing protein [Nitrospiraceae bacterium]MDR4486393.1 TRAM domain-containing protein [Nitrospirales bacterium]